MSNKNTHFTKLKRTLTSILPVSDNRKGNCVNCGACCKLPNPCFFLEYDNKKYHCSIYVVRPLNCRRYPRTDKEHITKESCGFWFEE